MRPCLLFFAAARASNVVYVVTDDQDQMLGSSFPTTLGATPLAQTQKLLVDQGTTFTNAFIHVPICNPSRSTTLTGRYFHNIKATGTPWANMHVDMNKVHNESFAVNFKEAGFATALIGKYANAMPDGFVPKGWDTWLANGGGDYANPQFASYNVPGLDDGNVQLWGNYTVAVVGNESVKFLNRQLSSETPFLLYCAPKAVHEPFDPAPWHVGVWDDSWPDGPGPRGPAWNMTKEDRAKHAANVPTMPLISDEAAAVVTGVWKNRWRSLLSVDDVVAALVREVDAFGALDDTYFFYASDHGFQLGQLNMLMDKRHAYDWDTRIPFVVRGPGFGKGVADARPVTNVDLAPTFAALAGVAPRDDWDGRSLLETDDWRTSVLVEYYYNDANTKCVANCSNGTSYPDGDSYCTDLVSTPNDVCWGPGGNEDCNTECYPTENDGNNFIALRRLVGADVLYARYQTGDQAAADINFTAPDAHELFRTDADPWCVVNAYESATGDELASLDGELDAWFACAGAACP